MTGRSDRAAWDPPVAAVRVGDLVLTRSEGTARLSHVQRAARPAPGEPWVEERVPRKEAGLLAFLMDHHRQIVSKSRLIDAVWGMEGASHGVLDVHMTRLRKILQRLDATGAHVRIETRRGMGYALHVEEGGQ